MRGASECMPFCVCVVAARTRSKGKISAWICSPCVCVCVCVCLSVCLSFCLSVYLCVMLHTFVYYMVKGLWATPILLYIVSPQFLVVRSACTKTTVKYYIIGTSLFPWMSSEL